MRVLRWPEKRNLSKITIGRQLVKSGFRLGIRKSHTKEVTLDMSHEK